MFKINGSSVDCDGIWIGVKYREKMSRENLWTAIWSIRGDIISYVVIFQGILSELFYALSIRLLNSIFKSFFFSIIFPNDFREEYSISKILLC